MRSFHENMFEFGMQMEETDIKQVTTEQKPQAAYVTTRLIKLSLTKQLMNANYLLRS